MPEAVTAGIVISLYVPKRNEVAQLGCGYLIIKLILKTMREQRYDI